MSCSPTSNEPWESYFHRMSMISSRNLIGRDTQGGTLPQGTAVKWTHTSSGGPHRIGKSNSELITRCKSSPVNGSGLPPELNLLMNSFFVFLR